MKWSILILTCPGREKFLQRLLDVLNPQVAENPDVEIRIRMDNRNMDRGQNRKALIEEAEGQYVCFIDDDDLVPRDYVNSIYKLLDGVDYIGFRVQAFQDNQPLAPTYHSLKYLNWSQDSEAYYRDLSHVNPIRKELALQGVFCGTGNEDVTWADSMRGLMIVKNEYYIPKVMYWYFVRSTKNDAVIPPLPEQVEKELCSAAKS